MEFNTSKFIFLMIYICILVSTSNASLVLKDYYVDPPLMYGDLSCTVSVFLKFDTTTSGPITYVTALGTQYATLMYSNASINQYSYVISDVSVLVGDNIWVFVNGTGGILLGNFTLNSKFKCISVDQISLDTNLKPNIYQVPSTTTSFTGHFRLGSNNNLFPFRPLQPICIVLSYDYTCSPAIIGNDLLVDLAINSSDLNMPGNNIYDQISIRIEYVANMSNSMVINMVTPFKTALPTTKPIFKSNYMYPSIDNLEIDYGIKFYPISVIQVDTPNEMSTGFPTLITSAKYQPIPAQGNSNSMQYITFFEIDVQTFIYINNNDNSYNGIVSTNCSATYSNQRNGQGLKSLVMNSDVYCRIYLSVYDFTPTQTIILPLLKSGNIPSYPYGLISITMNGTFNIMMEITELVSIHKNGGITSTAEYKEKITYASINAVASSTIDSKPPVLIYATLYHFTESSYIVKLHIQDDISGFSQLKYLNNIYSASKLESGTLNDGSFIFEHELYESSLVAQVSSANGLIIMLSDGVGNIQQINGKCYNPNFDMIVEPIDNNFYINIDNVTYWDFYPKVIDTSTSSVNVYVYFNLTNPQVDLKPVFTIHPFQGSYYTTPYRFLSTQARWNPLIKLYSASIEIPMRLGNQSLFYGLNIGDIYDKGLIDRDILVAKFGPNVMLNVTSSEIDILGPLVEYIKPYSSIIFVVQNSKQLIGFNITISDNYNGLKSGYIIVKSTLDPLPIKIPILDSNRVSGDAKNGIYRLEFNATGYCKTHQYYIDDIYLEDNGGWNSKMVIDSYYPETVYNSIIKIYHLKDTWTINVTCLDALDNQPPVITSVTLSKNIIDVGSTNETDRSLEITITVDDGGPTQSGVSPTHIPVLYIKNLQLEDLTFTSSSYKLDSLGFLANVTYSVTLPYGFGVDGIVYFSIYGLMDNYMNYHGYSIAGLHEVGLRNYINTTFSLQQPNLLSSTSIFEFGGSITVRGRQLGWDKSLTKCFIDYRDNNGFVPAPITYLVGIGMYVQVPPIIQPQNGLITNLLLKVVNHNGYTSNIINVPVELYPPIHYFPPSEPIQCPSNCNGNGNCTNNGCQCVYPYYGSDCSQISNPTEPIPNPTDPIIVINDGNGTSTNNSSSSTTDISSIIAIYSIREIDFNDNVVKEYLMGPGFRNWTLLQTNSIITNGTNYIYSTRFGGGYDNSTMFNVTIQWFNQSVDIEYAGESIHLPSQSIKFQLFLTRYTFKSTLNTLQVVFGVGAETKIPIDECSIDRSQEYGLGNNNDINDLQWVQIRINDKSLFGSFIRRGIVDNRIIPIRNSLLSIQNPTFSSNNSINSFGKLTYIGVNVPYYYSTVNLDPNFSHLLNIDGNKGRSNRCDVEQGNKFPTGAIAGIVVGAAVLVAVSVASIIYIKKKRKQLKQKKKMELKLNQFKNNK